MGKLEQSLESMRDRLGVLLYQRNAEDQKRLAAEVEIKRLDGESAKLDYALQAVNAIGCEVIAEIQAAHREHIERLEKERSELTGVNNDA